MRWAAVDQPVSTSGCPGVQLRFMSSANARLHEVVLVYPAQMSNVRVLHVNDAAFVGANLIKAAREFGYQWRHLSGEQLRPWGGTSSGVNRWQALRIQARVSPQIARAQVLHVHYATAVRWLDPRFAPARPYVLHLHGTDIRTLWPDPVHHRAIQQAIDHAAHVFYSTPDLQANATRARSDAELLPATFDPIQIPPWDPQGYVAFCSRWDESKNAGAMIEAAAAISKASDGSIPMRGLDWGPDAASARTAGVQLQPRMDHAEYLRFLAGASVVIGQSSTVIGVSEIEALAIGAPMGVAGTLLPGPEGNPLPITAGPPEQVALWVRQAVADPATAATRLGSREWAWEHHRASSHVPRLAELYASLSSMPR